MNLKKKTLQKGSQVTRALDHYHAFGISLLPPSLRHSLHFQSMRVRALQTLGRAQLLSHWGPSLGDALVFVVYLTTKGSKRQTKFQLVYGQLSVIPYVSHWISQGIAALGVLGGLCEQV